MLVQVGLEQELVQVQELKCEVEQQPCYTRPAHACVCCSYYHSDTPGMANRQVAAQPAQGDSGQAVLCEGDGVHYTSDIPTAVSAVVLIQS